MTTLMKRKLSATDAAKLANAVLDVDDLKRLGIALAVTAAEEVIRNTAFAHRVRKLYDEVPASTRSPRRADPFAVQLTPIKHIEGRALDPAAPLDPYFLLEAYGTHQLEAALSLYSVAKLKEAAVQVERQNPGTKPRNRGQKAALVEYITSHVKRT